MTSSLETPSSFWHAKAAIARTFACKRPPVDADTKDTLCCIARGLFLSSCHLEAQKAVLQRHGVTHILQVGKELSPTHGASFTYKHVPVYDLEEEDLIKHFPGCFAFINVGREAGGVLVHCAAGISRSATVVIGYLMAHGGLSLEDARAAVKASRPAINPNQGFVLQLQLFQEAGCSADGWRQWNLERFLQVRSAAYPRSEAVAPGTHQVRGACEVSPPELSREDSVSPNASPGPAPVRSTAVAAGPPAGLAGASRGPSAAVGQAESLRLDQRGQGNEGVLLPLAGAAWPAAATAAVAMSPGGADPQSPGRCFVRQMSADDVMYSTASADLRSWEPSLVPPCGAADPETQPGGPAAQSDASRHTTGGMWDARAAAAAGTAVQPQPAPQPQLRPQDLAAQDVQVGAFDGALRGPAVGPAKCAAWRGLWGGLRGVRLGWAGGGAGGRDGVAAHRVSSPALYLPTDAGAATAFPRAGPVVAAAEGGPGAPRELSARVPVSDVGSHRSGVGTGHMGAEAAAVLCPGMAPGQAEARTPYSLPREPVQPQPHQGDWWVREGAGGAVEDAGGSGDAGQRGSDGGGKDDCYGEQEARGDHRRNSLRRSHSEGLPSVLSRELNEDLDAGPQHQPRGMLPPLTRSPRISTESGGSSSALAAGPEADSDCRTSSTSRPSGSSASTGSCAGSGHGGGGGEDGSEATSSGARVVLAHDPPRPSPDPVAGSGAARSRALPWALLPILTPAGLERTPSKAPLTPVAGTSGDAGGSGASWPEARGPSAPPEPLRPASPLGPVAAGCGARPRAAAAPPTPTPAALGDTAASAAAQQSTPAPAFLSHLVMALALSQGNMTRGVAAAAAAAAGLNVRANANLACSRANSLGGAAAAAAVAAAAAGPTPPRPLTDPPSTPYAQPGTGTDTAYGEPGQQQQRTPSGSPYLETSPASDGGSPSWTPPSSGRPVGSRASRLATATFARSTGAAGNRSCDGSSSSSYDDSAGGGAMGGALGKGDDASQHKTVYGSSTGGSDVCKGDGASDGGVESSFLRRSAPSAVTADALTTQHAAGEVAGAAAPVAPAPAPADQAAPADAVQRPSDVRTRMSSRSLRPCAQHHSHSGVASASSGVAEDTGQDGRGTGTPIHKRVLRSLTSLLSRAPESPTPAQVQSEQPDGAGASGGPSSEAAAPNVGPGPGKSCGEGSADEGGWSIGRASRRRLWSGAFGAAAPPLVAAEGSGCGAAGAVAGVAPAAWSRAAPLPDARTALESQGADAQGVPAAGVRSAVLLPPAPLALAGAPTTAPAPPSPLPHAGLALAVRPRSYGGGGAGGNLLVGATEVGISDVVQRALSRSRSSSPTCVAAAAAAASGQQPCRDTWPHDVPHVELLGQEGADDVGAQAQGWDPSPHADVQRRPCLIGREPGLGSAFASKTVVGLEGSLELQALVDLDLLPEAPFRWDLDDRTAAAKAEVGCESDVAVAASSAAAASAAAAADPFAVDGVSPMTSNGTELARWYASTGRAAAPATAASGAVVAAAAAPRHSPRRMGSRHLSLDGSGSSSSSGSVAWGPHWAAPTAIAGAGAPTAYLASLAAVASAALLQEPSMPLVGERDASSCADAAAGADRTTTAGRQAAGWAATPATTTTPATRGAVQRPGFASQLGLNGPASCPFLASGLPASGPTSGMTLASWGPVAASGRVLEASTHSTGAHALAATATAAAHPPPRSSYSGALSMQPPPRSSWALSLLQPSPRSATAPPPPPSSGATAAAEAVAPPPWTRPPQSEADVRAQAPALPFTVEGHPNDPVQQRQGPWQGLPPSPQSSPLPLSQGHGASELSVPPGDLSPGSGGGGGGGSAWRATVSVPGPLPPLWGGSRSSASLITMPSEPEPDAAPASASAAQPAAEQQHQHHSQPASRLGHVQIQPQPNRQSSPASGSGSGSAPSVRVTVRSTSTGSSAAAHAAAAAAGGSLAPEAARAWEHFRAVRQQQPPHQQPPPPQQQQRLQAAPSPSGGGAAAATIAAAADGQLSTRTPSLSGSGVGVGVPAKADLLQEQQQPQAGAAASNPTGGPVFSSSSRASWEATSPAAPSPRPTGGRLALSLSTSPAGSSADVLSPRTPPAMHDLSELEPLSPRHSEPGCGGSGSGGQAPATLCRTMAQPPSQASPTTTASLSGRLWDATAPPRPAPSAAKSSDAAQRAPTRPDPSLLRPVLGRRLLPMPPPPSPSPSCITASPIVTPHTGAGLQPLAPQQPHPRPAPAVAVTAFGQVLEPSLEGGSAAGSAAAASWAAAAVAAAAPTGSDGGHPGLMPVPTSWGDLTVRLPQELLAAARAATDALDAAERRGRRVMAGSGNATSNDVRPDGAAASASSHAAANGPGVEAKPAAAAPVLSGAVALLAGEPPAAAAGDGGGGDGGAAVGAAEKGWGVGDGTAQVSGDDGGGGGGTTSGGAGSVLEVSWPTQRVRSPCGVCVSKSNSEDGTGG